jgi:hypothetical protein
MSILIDTALAQTGTAKLNEDGQVHQLKAQGQDVMQIAVDLSLTSAAVGSDLLIDIPRYAIPAALLPVRGSAVSVRV